MDGLIHGCSGWLQDANHGERFVVMGDKAYFSGPVGDDDGIADSVSQRPGNLGTQDRIENTFKPTAFGYFQCASAGKTKMLEIVGIRAHHAVAQM